MTFSDKDLDKRIEGQRRLLAKAKPGSWTEGKLQEALDWLLRQRALPRPMRQQWQHGTL